jgi:hypothetical protein
MMSVMFGTNGNDAIVRIGYPSLTPQSPLIVTILSKENIRATGSEITPGRAGGFIL